MTRATLSRLAVITGGILLAVYFYLNEYKLSSSVDSWSKITAGQSAVMAKIMLGDELLAEKKLKSSEIFDAEGRRQVNFVQMTEDKIDQARSQAVLCSRLCGLSGSAIGRQWSGHSLFKMGATCIG